ncbi:hypothetical protein WA026_018334 [Henosepilachna vigintioctopunctata]|uniref:cystathionine gamma-lyase n=1 Tax=Henosepilachna vigintioctopunctata TaxID=420089 RepID=A0AAW1VFB2_9CUCU
MSNNSGYLPIPKSFATSAIHVAQNPDQWPAMDVVTPISLAVTFKQDGPGDFKKYEYSRSGNPTRDVLEKVIASLEGGNFGACFSSGLGAATAILSLLKQGDHLICVDDVYGGTNRLLSKVAVKFGIQTTFSGVDIESFERAVQKNTRMIWLESPTNPTLKLCDIQAISALAKKYNILCVVDNTFLTPYLQRPLSLGADIVTHSITKYMNGHSDIIMGAVIVNEKKLYDDIKFLQNSMGIVPSPFDCYQVLRSLKTLAVRMKQHSESSLIIAKHLEGHPKIEKVIHPGLPSHPQHELAKKQTSGHSGMLTIYIKGNLESSKKFLKSLKVFTLAESLGGYESLIELPSVMTHAALTQEHRDILGIKDNLLRISVGLEDTEDLIADLDQALALI